MEASIAKILNNVNTSEIYGSNDRSVEGLVIDSRLASPGTMFIATRGTVTDGHNFIENAVEKGAVAVVCEDFPSEISENVIYIKVKDSSFALGLIASNFYDNPSKKLKLIGITGTNGKTTTATLLYNLTRKLGYRAGLISTVKYYINEKEVDSTHTTPDSISLNMLMKQMVDDHCDYCFMEVSSHAIAQERISGLHFEGGVFTNITHDHLDYHKTFENYIKTKKKFFDILPDTSFSLVNDDDKNGRIMIQNTASRKFTYSIHSASDFKCRIHESNFDGMLLNLEGKELWTKLIGKFNA